MRGVILIDSGWPDYSAPIILEKLAYWELDKLPITHVLLTHWHSDHAGNAKIFQDMGACLVASSPDQKYIEAGLAGYLLSFEETDYFFKHPPPTKLGYGSERRADISNRNLEVHAIPDSGHSAGFALPLRSF